MDPCLKVTIYIKIARRTRKAKKGRSRLENMSFVDIKVSNNVVL